MAALGAACGSLMIPSYVGAHAFLSSPSAVPVDSTNTSDTSPNESQASLNAPGDQGENDFMDLERSLSECISSNPPPGCGREPTGPGDRGGWQQLALFGVMTSGMGLIFWRVSRAVRRRDAATSDSLSEPT